MTTTYAPASDALLDALTRLTITRTGEVTEAEVAATGGGTYRVRLQGSRWACSCPAAIYARRDARPCKHVMALRILRDALPTTALSDRHQEERP